jgi:hypothetical protein
MNSRGTPVTTQARSLLVAAMLSFTVMTFDYYALMGWFKTPSQALFFGIQASTQSVVDSMAYPMQIIGYWQRGLEKIASLEHRLSLATVAYQ